MRNKEMQKPWHVEDDQQNYDQFLYTLLVLDI